MSAEPVAAAVAGVGAWADGESAHFRVADPQHALAGITLRQDLPLAPDRAEFGQAGDDWVLTVTRPPVRRLEYLLELRYPDGAPRGRCPIPAIRDGAGRVRAQERAGVPRLRPASVAAGRGPARH